MTTAVTVLLVPLTAWFLPVNRTVAEPYLDEVFHVRQAQHFCAGRFDVWDAKITTPPGLYLLSTLLAPVLGCSLSTLRAQNAIYLIVICALLIAINKELTATRGGGLMARMSALNIALFPPLFFFSALYYTDVVSTLSVLLFYFYFLRSKLDSTNQAVRHVGLVVLGLASLMFRQTNIFWVAVYPAAIELIHELDRGHQAIKDSMYRKVEGFGDTLYSVAKTSWKMEAVFDPPVREASLDDYVRTLVSLAACCVKVLTQPARLQRLCSRLLPYFALIACFASFVWVNGGVVLGDKGNHVATLHLPQMLYIWPYITFFSWPLLCPYLLFPVVGMLAKGPQTRQLEGLMISKDRNLLPRLWLRALFVALAGVVVRFNTIVHPFTLADNRHYTFYVFRLLLRPWWMRYAATPVYVLCGWACIQALGGGLAKSADSQDRASGDQSTTVERNSDGHIQITPRRLPSPDGEHCTSVSFVLIWLATSALQLITAPLVEPRYFILPWIFWRMHLPVRQIQETSTRTRGQAYESWWETFDVLQLLETVWLLAINAATGYIFLSWGFEWPQEPGQVQRFMW